MTILELDLENNTDTTIKPKSGFFPRWKVLLHNDDETPAKFVVLILNKFFNKTVEDAQRITTQVHHEGIGLAGIYPKEQAEFRADQTIRLARNNKFPLELTIEED